MYSSDDDDGDNLSDREKLGRLACATRLSRLEAADAWRTRANYFQPDLPYWPLRHDLGDTAVTIMRVNSQLYTEARQLLYDHRSFELHLRGPEILSFGQHDSWLGNDFNPKRLVDAPDLPFRHMQSIEIVIECPMFGCFCEEGLQDADYDCFGTLCYPELSDALTTLAHTLSQWTSLRRLTIDIIDTQVSELEIRDGDNDENVRRLVDLLRPLRMVRGLERVEILFYSRELDWNPTLEWRISELKKTMTTPGAATSRTDRPLEKIRMKNAIDFARAAGVRDFYRPSFADLMDPHSFTDEIKDFTRNFWDACHSGNEELIASYYEGVKDACHHQKEIADEALGWIDELLENKSATYSTDAGPPMRLT